MVSTAIYLPLLALAANVSQPAPSPPATEGTSATPGFMGELHGGYHGPLGAVGMALVVPWQRFAVGAGIGFAELPPSETSLPQSMGVSPLRAALFGRFAVIDGQRFRLALAAGISYGGESDTATTSDAQIFWERVGYRYDLGLGGEMAAGPAWIGLESGVGYLASSAACTQITTSSAIEPCNAGQSGGAPSNWVPYVGLTIRLRDRLPASAASAIEAAEPATKLRVFALGSALDSADVFSDGHFDGDPDYSGGLEADALFAPGQYLRVGVGVRYELAHVPPMFGNANGADHFLSVPVLIGGAIPLAGRRELELLAGIGIGAGWVRGGATSDGSTFLNSIGLTTEVSITYWEPVTRAVDLSLGVAATFEALEIQNGGTYFENGAVFRGVIPLRFGARWSL